MKRIASFLFGLALLLGSIPAHAAASSQLAHAWMCAPSNPSSALQQRVVVPNTAGDVYTLNSEGCALIQSADIGYFQSQGFVNGPNIFTLTQTGISAATTTSTSTIVLPAYGYIQAIVVCETAGNAITGGISIGDSGSATRFISGTNYAVGANACATATDANLTRLYITAGVPTADQILVAAGSSFNSGIVNVTIIYSYY